MEAVLLRTGSVPALDSLTSPRITSSRSNLSNHDLHVSGSSDFNFNSLRLSFSDHRSKDKTMRRAMSESDMMSGVVQASGKLWIGGVGCRSASIVEGLNESDDESIIDSGGRGKGKEVGRCGGGFGRGGGDGISEVDLYYKHMLKMNPMDPLLLRNYARFLHEVMKDTVRADEYYGRAILANPGDGEVLGLYGKFIWETQKDCERAKFYFDQAVHASPENSMVMGMYAEFMWENEDEEEDKDCLKMNEASFISSATFLANSLSLHRNQDNNIVNNSNQIRS